MKKVTLLLLPMLMSGLSNVSAQFPAVKKDSISKINTLLKMDTIENGQALMEREIPMPLFFNRILADKKTAADTIKAMLPDLSGWPEASRMAAEEIAGKYGKPDRTSEDQLIWMDKGVWKHIRIDKKETKHNFPIEHTDMLQTTILYRVPVDKMSELSRFDGSITFDRTQGTMSARCDKEANNILALNLAYDIIKSKITVYQARIAYGNIVKQYMNKENPLYMQSLLFPIQKDTADPDVNTTGLTRKDVINHMQKTIKK
jgi:hypothetical protein